MGPLLFKAEDAPTYGPGFKAVVITASVAAGLALVYRYLCIWENKQRDREGIMEAFEHAYEDDVTDRKVCFHVRMFCHENKASYTDMCLFKNPQFRYVY